MFLALTDKSNPYRGILAVRFIRNLLSVWNDEKVAQKEKPFPVVYNTYSKDKLFNSIETIVVASTEIFATNGFAEICLIILFCLTG